MIRLEDVEITVREKPVFVDPFERCELITGLPWAVQVNDVTYTVPGNMLFDGASIPRVFWRVVGPPMYGLYRPGALLHDACYKGVVLAVAFNGMELPVEKEEADELLYLMARWNGVSHAKAWTMYQAVAKFGGMAWRAEHKRYADRHDWFHYQPALKDFNALRFMPGRTPDPAFLPTPSVN